MAPAKRAPVGLFAIVATILAAMVFGFGGPAVAAPNFREAWAAVRGDDARNAATPQVARYIIDEGGDFVLDRSSKRALLKFNDSPEIWVLQSAAGPRGDIIYKNDAGEPMLRATKLGGMTVFTPRRPGGSAASLSGASQPLRLPPLGPFGLYQRFFQASVRASRAAQHLIGFETAQDAESSTGALFADASAVAVEAVVAIAANPQARPLLGRIGKIVFTVGSKPTASVNKGVLTVTVAPTQGLAGRPSSRRIQRAIGLR